MLPDPSACPARISTQGGGIDLEQTRRVKTAGEASPAPNGFGISLSGEVEFPFPALRPGELARVNDDLIWLSLPLPFKLDHVNVYLLRDGAGWALIDTGIGTPQGKSVWLDMLGGPLSGLRISRVIVTHFHPDHLGLAGWFCDRYDAPLLTSTSTYILANNITAGVDRQYGDQHVRFLMRTGLDEKNARSYAQSRAADVDRVAALPATYIRLLHGDSLDIGDHRFVVLSGDGHAAEQTMLYSRDGKMLFAADQVMERITPNVGVEPTEPDSDPLGHYLRSLRYLSSFIPDDVLVLAGHKRPFYGLERRCNEIISH